jgi:SAM-dependent methyltransferase
LNPEVLLWERYGPLFSLEEGEIYPPDMMEIRFYQNFRKKHPGKCMELGAGDGRLTGYLDDGSHVIALEPSASMLNSWPTGMYQRISRIRAIAQNIPLRNASLDLILFPYNGIHCILDRDERKLAFREIAAVLKPGGEFFAETCPAFHIREQETRKERYDYNESGTSLRLVESVSHDREKGLIVFDMEYSGSAVVEKNINIRLELALISASELLQDIRNEGMKITGIWGDYDLSPWDADCSPRLLVLAERDEK